jgi:hypothetical protein
MIEQHAAQAPARRERFNSSAFRNPKSEIELLHYSKAGNDLKKSRISQIMRMEMDTVRQTYIVGTGRDQAMVHPVMAEVALLRDTAVRVISDGVIGAFLDAGLTPGT